MLVLAQIPIGEELHLGQQALAVVGREDIGAAGLLDTDQRAEGVGVEFRRRFGVEGCQVGGVAQVGQQQEALFLVPVEDLRDLCAGFPEQGSNLDSYNFV